MGLTTFSENIYPALTASLIDSLANLNISRELYSDNLECSSVSGELFAQGIIDKYPGVCIEQVSDSSRYFVFRILDPNGKFLSLQFII